MSDEHQPIPWQLIKGEKEEPPPSYGQLRDDLALAQARVKRLTKALESALEQTDDGLHSSPCDEPECWVEMARASLGQVEQATDPSTEE